MNHKLNMPSSQNMIHNCYVDNTIDKSNRKLRGIRDLSNRNRITSN